MNDSLAKSECPSIKALSVLIDGSDVTDPELVSHVDTCVDCQTRLDRLTQPTQLEHYGEFARSKSTEQQAFLDPPLRSGDLGSFNGFGIESEIGSGGMGVVYRARDEQLGRTVALKVLTCAASPTALARFDRESHAASNLSHPGIVPIYSAGKSNEGRPYLVMPLIEGKSLKQAIQENSLTFRETAEFISRIAAGLHAAHQSGLIHRDVKPANILIDQVDGRAKLVDFGLVRGVDDQTLTRTEMMCGTPEYMSPEQANTETSDARCDVYSLGITLYECLTGSVPFRGRPLDILAQHRDLEPVPPSRMNKLVPRDMETICLKAIKKDIDHRYLTAADFANDLQSFLDGRPIQARPASRLEKSWRWARRNPRVALLTTALLVTLFGGILTTTGLWQRSQINYVEAQANFVAAKENFDAATEMVINTRQFAFRLAHELGHEIAARDLYREVLEEVDKLVVLRNDDPAILLLQPKVYLSNGEIEFAVGKAEDSIRLFDKSELLFLEIEEKELRGLANAKSKVASDQHATSIHHVREFLSSVALQRGEAYHQTGNTAKALEDLQSANKILVEQLREIATCGNCQRNLALVQVLEGQVWADLGQDGKALRCYQSAYSSLPAKLVLKGLALTYAESRDPDLIVPKATDHQIINSIEKHINAYVVHYLGRHLVATARSSDNPKLQTQQGTTLLSMSLEIRRNINAEVPAISGWKRDVAMTLTELAKAAQQLEQIDTATERINESVEILTAMAATSDRLELRLRLAQALIVRSELSMQTSPDQRALDLLRAQELCQDVLVVSPSWQECTRVLSTIQDKLDSNNVHN